MLVPTVVVVSLACCTVDVPQASEAVGGVKTGVPLHAIVVLVPGAPMVGAVVSCTVMLWLTVPLVFPQPSVARQVRVKVFEQESPLTMSLPTVLTVAPLQLSLAVGGALKVGVYVAGQPSTVVLSPAGPMLGAVASCTVML